MSFTDAAFRPRGLEDNHHHQLSTRHKISPPSSVYAAKSRSTSAAITPASVWSRKPVTINETPKISRQHVEDHSGEDSAKTTEYTTWATPYPKVLQSGAVENFRPQEVQEKVTYAEPLSPPNEEEVPETIAWDKEGEDDWNIRDVGHPEEEATVVQESAVSYQFESNLSSEPPLHEEVKQHQYTAAHLTPYHVRMAEESCGFPDEPDKDEPSEVLDEEEQTEEPHAPIEAWLEEEFMGNAAENAPEETSDSETEALLEPTCESRTSTPASEPEESFFNYGGAGIQDREVTSDDADMNRRGIKSSEVVEDEADFEDKLYPDGEEMDTWDSVIERKAELKTDENMKINVEKGQHAEPEEDISAREHDQSQTRQEATATIVEQENTSSSTMDKQDDDDRQNADLDKERLPEKDEEENDDEEDSQNVSVSWRTELEGDSYAQDNTLADTRPLIRYKSDETDFNTQASHRDESESSEGEEDQKAGETGSGAWYGSKSRRSGTMEDLCEEADGESLDEDYDLGYAHVEDRDVRHVMGMTEHDDVAKDRESGEEMINEGHAEEETKEPTKPVDQLLTDLNLHEELDTDKLVEQELENLSTYSYSAHFAQKKLIESDEAINVQDKFVEEMTKEEEPEVMVSSSHVVKEHFGDRAVKVPCTDILAEDEVQHEDHKTMDPPEKAEEEDEYNVSMVTHADVREDQELWDQIPTGRVTADSEDLQEVVKMEAASVEALSASQEHPIEEVPYCEVSPEFPETAEQEVPENPGGDIRVQNEDDHMYDEVTGSLQSFHADGGTHQGAVTQSETSPDSVPDDAEIYLVKNSTESYKTNSKDNGLHGFFNSGIKDDLWVSSSQTGATYQPDDACNEAAERSNQNLEFSGNLLWGDLENPNVVNGNSRMDIDSSKASAAKKEQELMEVKQAACRDVVEGQLVHSEGSEGEGESWSSGEE